MKLVQGERKNREVDSMWRHKDEARGKGSSESRNKNEEAKWGEK